MIILIRIPPAVQGFVYKPGRVHRLGVQLFAYQHQAGLFKVRSSLVENRNQACLLRLIDLPAGFAAAEGKRLFVFFRVKQSWDSTNSLV